MLTLTGLRSKKDAPQISFSPNSIDKYNTFISVTTTPYSHHGRKNRTWILSKVTTSDPKTCQTRMLQWYGMLNLYLRCIQSSPAIPKQGNSAGMLIFSWWHWEIQIEFAWAQQCPCHIMFGHCGLGGGGGTKNRIQMLLKVTTSDPKTCQTRMLHWYVSLFLMALRNILNLYQLQQCVYHILFWGGWGGQNPDAFKNDHLWSYNQSNNDTLLPCFSSPDDNIEKYIAFVSGTAMSLLDHGVVLLLG